MGHAAEANELLKIFGDELGAVVADNPGFFSGELFPRPLDNRLDILLGHAFADLPMDDEAAIAVQQRAEIVKGAAQVEVADINVPVPVPTLWLYETGSFLGRRACAVIKSTCRLQDAVDTGGTDRHDVVVEHHKGQAAITIEWMRVVVVEDGLLFPVLKPPIARNLAVVLVGLAIAPFPIVKLARAESQPAQQAFGGQLCTNRPVADVIDDVVASVVRNPAAL